MRTKRAELENFARAVADKRPLAAPGGDEEHGAAVLEIISKSAGSGRTVRVPGTAKK
jgi:predicted dehydrogenase